MTTNYLSIFDASAYIPIRDAIVERRINSDCLTKYCEVANTKLLVTKTAWDANEFCGTYTAQNFDQMLPQDINEESWQTETNNFGQLKVKDVYLSNNGSVVANTFCDPAVTMTLVDDSKLLTRKSLWSGTNTWAMMSSSDQSAINIARYYIENAKKVVVFANDKQIRRQAEFENISFTGSCGFLTALADLTIIKPQKATKIYDWWKVKDSGWAVQNMTFAQMSKITRSKKLWIR